MRKNKTTRVFIRYGSSGFEENCVKKALDDDLKKDLSKFHFKIDNDQETGIK